jgi:hypothetical protein
MKIFISILVGMSLCRTAHTEWKQYAVKLDESPVYYDPGRLSQMPNGNFIIWHKQRYSETELERINLHMRLANDLLYAAIKLPPPYKILAYKDYSHTLQKYIYDCSLQRYAVASYYLYSNTGNTLNIFSSGVTEKSDWKFQDILPETTEEKLMNIVCKK